MKNTITILPVTDEISSLADAVRIKNDFLQMGFDSRKAFLEVVCDYKPEYKNPDKVQVLMNWWLLRIKDCAVNDDMQTVINHLKNE